ncbi:hypothetical protein T439DRAFT_322338, partial [Meredithblackwellia eburnea MCA 4105]
MMQRPTSRASSSTYHGDITDSYRDEHSQYSISPRRTRHPRGDSPLSVVDQRLGQEGEEEETTSRGNTTVLPSLEKLLDFLDGEVDDQEAEPGLLEDSRGESTRFHSSSNQQQQRQGTKRTPPPTVVRPTGPPNAPWTAKSVRLSFSQGGGREGPDWERAREGGQVEAEHEDSFDAGAAPPHATLHAQQEPDTATTTGDVEGELSPSARTEMSRRSRSRQQFFGGAGIEVAGAGIGGGGEEGPNSPSPKPGTMAELRERSRLLEEQAGERTRELLNVKASSAERESTSEIGRIADEVLDEFESIISRRHTPPMLSRSRSLPVSSSHTQQHHPHHPVPLPFSSNSNNRPPSRLRNIPSPPSSEGPAPSVSGGSASAPSHYSEDDRGRVVNHDIGLGFSPEFSWTGAHAPLNHGEQEKEDLSPRSKGVHSFTRPAHAGRSPYTQAYVEPRPSNYRGHHDDGGKGRTATAVLLDEVEACKASIAHLHSELRDINSLVGSLRLQPQSQSRPFIHAMGTNWRRDGMDELVDNDPERTPRRRRFAPGGWGWREADEHVDEGYGPSPRKGVGREWQRHEEDERELQGAWAVMKHTISLLPTPDPASSSLSLNSISNALQFIRNIDELVQDPRGMKRRDEDIFKEENLERLERRLKGWSGVVRGSGSGEAGYNNGGRRRQGEGVI